MGRLCSSRLPTALALISPRHAARMLNKLTPDNFEVLLEKFLGATAVSKDASIVAIVDTLFHKSVQSVAERGFRCV